MEVLLLLLVISLCSGNDYYKEQEARELSKIATDVIQNGFNSPRNRHRVPSFGSEQFDSRIRVRPHLKPETEPFHSHQVERVGAGRAITRSSFGVDRGPTYQRQPTYTRDHGMQMFARRTYHSEQDPCETLGPGQYELKGQFSYLFPKADMTCNFVKCANSRAYLTPCGAGTRNTLNGKGFCSIYDTDGYCSPTETRYISKKKQNQAPYSSKRDPCLTLEPGQYELTGEMTKYFPHADSICFFVKCANKKAFLNRCGYGSRNDEAGGGFCSIYDGVEGYCKRSRRKIAMETKPNLGHGATRSYSSTPTKRTKRKQDPCHSSYDGQYVLDGAFSRHFPYINNRCFFVKCANRLVFLNPCGPGTRNADDGSGFCSVLDLEGLCGHAMQGQR